MTDTRISDREHRVLEAITRNYIVSAAPTSSRFLSRQDEFNHSPATIRNIMSDLEEKGFIRQPHTSAGRVPTDKGYRYYVDQLMKVMELPLPVKQTIKNTIGEVDSSDLHMVMEATSRALSSATRQLGVALSPNLQSGIFRHVHIFQLHPGRYVLNVTINSGVLKRMTVELASDVSESRLEQACHIINERFYGMALREMLAVEVGALSDIDADEQEIVRMFIPSIKRLIESDEQHALYAEGTANIMLQPEFFNKEQIGVIIEIVKEQKFLMHLFDTADVSEDRTVISIGGENREGALNAFSIVKRRYSVGSMDGCLGIVGPKRMPYPLLVSAVDYTARVLGEIYSGE